MAGRKAIQKLAALVYTIDDDTLAILRDRAEASCARQVEAGTYVTGLAWRSWSHCADHLSQWIAMHPDAPVPRDDDFDHPKHALEGLTRKNVARLLADRWQNQRGIHPQRRVDTADNTQ